MMVKKRCHGHSDCYDNIPNNEVYYSRSEDCTIAAAQLKKRKRTKNKLNLIDGLTAVEERIKKLQSELNKAKGKRKRLQSALGSDTSRTYKI
jgi:seryl-tRNA synthetase